MRWFLLLALVLLFGCTQEEPILPTEKTSSFLWGDVYKPEGVSTARYSITVIKDGEQEDFDAVLIFDDNTVSITTYFNNKRCESDGKIVFSDLNYRCLEKFIDGKKIDCKQSFGDELLDYSSIILPTFMDKDIPLTPSSVEMIYYAKSNYEGVRLHDTDTDVWVSKVSPLPVRIVTKDEGITIIANLKTLSKKG
ncbi:MAG: hypothetical protein ACTSVF_00435 [Candidatus Asgardarchaeia archaeon]